MDTNLAVSNAHMFSSSMLNESRFSLVRRDLDFPENDPISPTAAITGFFTIGGPTNFPQWRVTNAYQFSDTMTWTRGEAHAEVRRRRPLQRRRQQRRLQLEGHLHVRQPAGLHEQQRLAGAAGAADRELAGHAVAERTSSRRTISA